MKRAKKAAPARAADARQDEKRQLYVKMVAAVRAWLAVEHPQPLHDRVDIALYSDLGGGESVAWFHASAVCPYVRGDLMAMDDE